MGILRAKGRLARLLDRAPGIVARWPAWMKAPRAHDPQKELYFARWCHQAPEFGAGAFPAEGKLTMRVYPKAAEANAEQWLGWEHHSDGDLGVHVNPDDPTTGVMDEAFTGRCIVQVGDWIVTAKGHDYHYKPEAFKRIFAELPAEKKEDA